jgi:hypothetical protein
MNLKRPTNGREATMIDPFWPDQLFPQLFLGSIHFSKHKAITSSSLRYLLPFTWWSWIFTAFHSQTAVASFQIGFSDYARHPFCCLPCQPRVSILFNTIPFRPDRVRVLHYRTVSGPEKYPDADLRAWPPDSPRRCPMLACLCFQRLRGPAFLALFPHVSQIPLLPPIPRAQSFPALYTAHPQVVFPRPAFVSIMTHI